MHTSRAPPCEQRVQDVHAGDRARQVAGVGAGLNQREQRHDVKAAEHADHANVEQDAQQAWLHQQLAQIQG